MSPHFGTAAGQDFAFDAARTFTVCFILVLIVAWSRRFRKNTMTEHVAEIWSQRSKKCLDTADEHEQSQVIMIDDDDDDDDSEQAPADQAPAISLAHVGIGGQTRKQDPEDEF